MMESFVEELELLGASGPAMHGPPAAELAKALEEALRTGETAAPGVVLSAVDFARHLARALGAPSAVTAADELRLVVVGDLYLTCACGAGNVRAIARVERAILSKVGAFIGHIDASPAFVDEVRQGLREKLLVSTGERSATILDYRGRGSLESWVRVAAVRTALNVKRSQKRANANHVHDFDLVDVAAGRGDPEVEMIRSLHKEHFRAAFHATLAELTADERTVLRMHYLDGLTIDEICVGFRVHRSTIARWLDRARKSVLASTLQRMKESAGGAQDVDSTMRLLESVFDVSVRGLLVAVGGEGESGL